MDTMNCLTRALDQWSDNPTVFRLWYDSGHVISIENTFDMRMLRSSEGIYYLTLDYFGIGYFKRAFKLNKKYNMLLEEYFCYILVTSEE